MNEGINEWMRDVQKLKSMEELSSSYRLDIRNIMPATITGEANRKSNER